MDPSRLQHPAKEHDASLLCCIGTLQPRDLVSTLGEVFRAPASEMKSTPPVVKCD
jgi:hypothetical protein